jgi:ribosomal protein S18 acetylase RimI-like enzyme
VPASDPPATLSIRRARASDLDAIARFNRAMALETEELSLDPERLREGVRAALSDEGRGAYRIAELDGRACGCLLVTREWSDWRNGWFWWIQSVYVEPELRRRGVYRALYGAVLDEARANGGVCGLRLYVDEANRPAQEVYRRLGMERTRYALFEVDFVLAR